MQSSSRASAFSLDPSFVKKLQQAISSTDANVCVLTMTPNGICVFHTETEGTAVDTAGAT